MMEHVELIRPSVSILQMTENPLQLIEKAGRTCYKSEDKITTDSAGPFVARLIRSGHESVLEHASATVRIITSRRVTHQLVRHRIASYSQESQRYCDYGGKVRFIIPEWMQDVPYDDMVNGTMINWEGRVPVMVGSCAMRWLYACDDAAATYMDLRQCGLPPEDARDVLPNCTATEIVTSMNFRAWRHAFKERTAKNADKEMRRVMRPLLDQFKARIPVVFDDITY